MIILTINLVIIKFTSILEIMIRILVMNFIFYQLDRQRHQMQVLHSLKCALFYAKVLLV